MRNRKSDLFITFEGGEGAGKTTLIQNLHRKLSEEQYDVIVTREPGGSVLGNKIREWLLTKNQEVAIGQVSELLLFLAARAQHIEELIKPALQANKIVLCDRFNDSTIAYQGGARHLGVSFVQQLCNQLCGDPLPKLTFYLNLDPEVGLKRRLQENKQEGIGSPQEKAHLGAQEGLEQIIGSFDRIESEHLDFHKCVQETFLLLAKQNPERIIIVDAAQAIDTVFDTVYKAIKDRAFTQGNQR